MNLTPKQDRDSWKLQTLLVGTLAGTVLGALSAYLYTRAAEDDVERIGQPPRPQTGDLIGLGLAMLAVVRQISELGRQEDKGRRRR